MPYVTGWAADAVARMTDEEVRRVVSEGAEQWRSTVQWIVPPGTSPDDQQAVMEEIERLCRRRVTTLAELNADVEQLEED